MKSKPVYKPLELDETARRHFFIAQGIGDAQAQLVLRAHPEVDASLFQLESDIPVAMQMEEALHQAGMDTAFYISGPEIFVWQVTKILRDEGVEKRRIRQEVAGSLARKVYCVHCCAMNTGITSTIYRCDRCGTALTVRDHFSRPLGAYMGVCADAERPGEVPEPEVQYA